MNFKVTLGLLIVPFLVSMGVIITQFNVVLDWILGFGIPWVLAFVLNLVLAFQGFMFIGAISFFAQLFILAAAGLLIELGAKVWQLVKSKIVSTITKQAE